MIRLILLLCVLLSACGLSQKERAEAARVRVAKEVANGRPFVGPLTEKEIRQCCRDQEVVRDFLKQSSEGKFVFIISGCEKTEVGLKVESDGTREVLEDEHQTIVITSGSGPLTVYLGHFENTPNQALPFR
ncbi:MAG: hypothetical protein QM715_21285 [Nibricoccus sp.]